MVMFYWQVTKIILFFQVVLAFPVHNSKNGIKTSDNFQENLKASSISSSMTLMYVANINCEWQIKKPMQVLMLATFQQ